MTQHRVILEAGVFIPQYKGWLFWHDYGALFDTAGEAIAFCKKESVAEVRYAKPPRVVWSDAP